MIESALTTVLSAQTKKLLYQITSLPVLKNFYLAGGTGLALQLKHRKSEDLDFFSPSVFSLEEIKTALTEVNEVRITYENHQTLHLVLVGTKVSFFYYNYPLLFDLLKHNTIKLADKRDIAAMKIAAIASRGTKRDFIDLYFLLQQYSVEQLLDFFKQKYHRISYSYLHLLKSLMYFQDAEDEPMPKMLIKTSWSKVKETLKQQTISLLRAYEID